MSSSAHGSHRAARGRAARRASGGTRRRGGTLLPRALVITVLVGGVTAFVWHDKEVVLDVDGSRRTVHTFAGDVRELLVQQHVSVGGHDTVTPAPGTALGHGDEVTVRRGRRLALTVDGRYRAVWTTATTVGEALGRLGVRTEGAYLSVPPATPVGRGGRRLDVRTERAVTFLVDGERRGLRTNASTVREALDAAGIVLRGQDTLSVPQFSFPRDGQTISVLRIRGAAVTREEPVPFPIVRRRDAGLFKGTEVVVVRGEEGLKRVTYVHRTVNGVKQPPVRVDEQVLRRPVTQVVKVGERALPTSVADAHGLNWAGLAECEAGGRPDLVDPSGTYGGLYQFDVQTWRALGGSGRPQDASAREQTRRAKKLYVRRGASPWPVCGRRLFT